MKAFMLKSFIAASIMFLSVLFGMEIANKGIHEMKGYDDPGFQSAFSLKKDERGSVETALLGNTITSHDLKGKKEEMEKLKAYNFFSSMGKKTADGVSEAARSLVKLISPE